MSRRFGVCCGVVLVHLGLLACVQAQTLARVRAAKTLRCGTIAETPEYSSSDDHGPRSAFDADLCRAVAVAVLGPRARTAITTYPDDVAAVAALHARRVDLIPTLTLDLTHASDRRITFSAPVLYDGVGFLVAVGARLTDADQLAGKKICFLAETHVEDALHAWFARRRLSFVAFPFQEEGEMEAAFVTGNCAALAGDLTRLVSTRLNFGPLASGYVLLGDRTPVEVASDPLAAASASSDAAFANIVRWTVEVLLNAEALGLTQPGVEARAQLSGDTTGLGLVQDRNADVLLGRTGEIGSELGLENSWAVDVVAAVGNYAEVYERDLGGGSALQLPRDQNRLYPEGLMLALPLK
jgi:general L-amino acid transport system substrate-binding protein